jgi:hypothetical protein
VVALVNDIHPYQRHFDVHIYPSLVLLAGCHGAQAEDQMPDPVGNISREDQSHVHIIDVFILRQSKLIG